MDGVDSVDGVDGNAGALGGAGRQDAGAPTGVPKGFEPKFSSELERRRYEMMDWQDQAAYDFSQEAGCSIADAKAYVEAKYTPQMLPKSHAQRQMLLNYLREHTYGELPLWQSISGWDKNARYELPERRRRIRHLIEAVKNQIRAGLLLQERDRGTEIEEERTVYWDPIINVCEVFGISQSALSRFSVELTGLNLRGLVDFVRAESVVKKMRAEAREFVLKVGSTEWGVGSGQSGRGGRSGLSGQTDKKTWKDEKTQRLAGGTPAVQGQCATLTTDEEKLEFHREETWAVWKALRESRKEPVFCRNTWALGYGFSSYQRMYKACKAKFQMTPQQMEITYIEEAIRLSEINECKMQNSKCKIDAPYLMGSLGEKLEGRVFKEWDFEELRAEWKGMRGIDEILEEERAARRSWG